MYKYILTHLKMRLLWCFLVVVSGFDELKDIPSAWKGHSEFAKWIVKEHKPTLIYDLGVDYGFSTFTFALAMQDQGRVVGVDLFTGDVHTSFRNTYDYVMTLKNKLETKYPINLEIVKDDFTNVAYRVNELIDIIHLDGLHTYEAAKHDYNMWIEFLDPNGLFLMHDTESFPGVRRVFDESPLYKVNFLHSAGLGVLSPNKDLIKRISTTFALHHDDL